MLVPKWVERAEKMKMRMLHTSKEMPSAPGIIRAVLLLSQRLQQEPPLEPGGAHRAPVLGLLGMATFPRAAQRRTSPLPCARTQKTTPA